MHDVICTERLELRTVTAAVVRADIAGPAELAAALGVGVPDGWPPPLVAAALEHMAEFLERHPELAPWGGRYWVSRATEVPALVGMGGFKGAPAAGDAELGYSVVETCQRRGYATEAVGAMVAWAFERGVDRVVAHTVPSLVASIKVLERNDFRSVGDGEEPGTIRFERTR
ncbi:MAG: GNAT family protein [Acidimicrobiales bacterium]